VGFSRDIVASTDQYSAPLFSACDVGFCVIYIALVTDLLVHLLLRARLLLSMMLSGSTKAQVASQSMMFFVHAPTSIQ
jgi:hypothetical protein